MFVTWRKSLSSQRLLTIRARKAFSMKRLILVANATLWNNLSTFGAFRGIILLIARYTVDFIIFRYETLGANGQVTRKTEKAILMKLLSLVFHFFHARLEYLRTFVTTRRKRLIIAFTTIQTIVLVPERLIHEPDTAQAAEKAFLMPVHVLVGEVLWIRAYLILA
jgi:hypothetical protein